VGESILQNQITQSLLSDLEEVNEHSRSDLEHLVNGNVVITGASGFIGTWLALSWASARKEFRGGGKLLLTSRSPQSVLEQALNIDEECPVHVISSDIKNFTIPDEFHKGHIIHAATPASASLNSDDPYTMFNVIIEGQERILAEALRTSSRLLFLSSGAVYGNQPLNLEKLSEECSFEKNEGDKISAYHDGKRAAEMQCDIATLRWGTDVVTARLFAFLAPFLPFGTHFAAGNFMQDALQGSQIVIKSGGGSVRSYQYGTDLCSSLWALAMRGVSGEKYNVGSDSAVTVKELADAIVHNVNPLAQVVVKGNDTLENVSRYVPSIQKISEDLKFENHVELNDAIARTATWWKQLKGVNEHG
jgi:nucleoside-diphosphate-sugar epimerase